METTPPFEPLRVTALILLFAAPVLFVLHTLPSWAIQYWKRRRQRQLQQAASGGGGGSVRKPACCGVTAGGSGLGLPLEGGRTLTVLLWSVPLMWPLTPTRGEEM